jgi:hypothetical protein
LTQLRPPNGLGAYNPDGLADSGEAPSLDFHQDNQERTDFDIVVSRYRLNCGGKLWETLP